MRLFANATKTDLISFHGTRRKRLRVPTSFVLLSFRFFVAEIKTFFPKLVHHSLFSQSAPVNNNFRQSTTNPDLPAYTQD